MTEVAIRQQPAGANLPAKLEYARTLAASGLLPAQYRAKPENVLYAVEYGDALGISPMAAITGVHVIEGKPSASANLIGALVRRAGHRLRVTGDNESATATIIRSDDEDFEFTVTWTMDMARAAGLANKGTWKNYPQAMLKARAISQVARDACEEALFGLHYTPEELGVETDADGNIIGGVVEPARALPAVADILDRIEKAMASDDPRQAVLNDVWNHYGPVLGEVILQTPDGEVTAANYIKNLKFPEPTVDAEVVSDTGEQPTDPPAEPTEPTEPTAPTAPAAAAGEPVPDADGVVDAVVVEETPAEQSAPAEQAEPPAKVAANAAQDAENAKPSAKDRQVKAWLTEARFQAEILGVNPVDFIAPLLAAAKTTDPYALSVARLKGYVVPARARVLAALREAGRTAEAGAYFAVANDQPAHPDAITRAAEGSDTN